MSDRILAVIPARGGSKRIPDKNVIDFMGKPLIAWTIEAALESEQFDEVVVSTDSQNIANISKELGASVPFLRENAHDDFSPVSEATLACLNQSEQFFKKKFETVVQLFAVCPLRTADDIRSFVSHFEHCNSEFLISCFEFHWMNPWWAHTLDQNSEPTSVFSEMMKKHKRSQDLPKLYSPTGAIWIATSKGLRESGTFYGPKHQFYPLDWKKSIDIDNYEDIELAKVLYKSTKS